MKDYTNSFQRGEICTVKKVKQKEKDRPKITRRQFLGVAAAAGTMATLSGCGVVEEIGGKDGWLPVQYRSKGQWTAQVKGRVPLDPNNIAVVRDDTKCVLCGQCL